MASKRTRSIPISSHKQSDDNDDCKINPPLPRRSTRLKTEIFIESYSEAVLANNKNDQSKQDIINALKILGNNVLIDNDQQGCITNTDVNGEMAQIIVENPKKRGKPQTGNKNLNKVVTNKDASSSQQEVKLPRKRGRPKLDKTTKSQPSVNDKSKMISLPTQKVVKKKSSTKSRKVTKSRIQNTSERKIPKNRFDDALSMLENDDHPIWEDRNVSCNASIHRHWENNLVSEQNMKLKYARQFLLCRDWISLSKVLCLSSADLKDKNIYYPLLAKYAALCLVHTDMEHFNKFCQFLINIDDVSSIMKKCTNITQENEK